MWLLFALVTAPALAQPEASPPEWLGDAELAAVSFLDADRGWVVGDRGVIWHTSDGGRNWALQNSGVTCRLEAVQFLDANNGWAAGGWTQPYTHETRGCILRTRDGGRTWQSIPGLLLPGLVHIKFFDAKSGWAMGDASPLFPAGVFRTDDGGRTWSPIPNGESLGWVTGDFRDVRSGAVAGLAGSLATVTTGELRPGRMPSSDNRFVRRLQLVGPSGGWLVGDGGLVMTTADGGTTWARSSGALPESVAGQLDFRALATLGSHVWIAGAPGTCVLHSADSGQTWQVQATDQSAPIHGMWFFDEYRGWAVGSLGTILHTRDGGQTWRVQRSGGKRVSLLGIFSDPQRLPLEVIAAASGSEAYLSAVEIIGRRDLEPASGPQDLMLRRRTHAAVVAAGGSAADTAWQFPLHEPGLPVSTDAVLARWNLATGGQAGRRLEEHLVRRIRQWRPEVIVTEDVSPRGDDPLGHLTSQITLAAAAKAADGTAWPEQILELGLSPWKVKKVLALQPEEKQGVVTITPAQWSPRLGCSLADQAESGRGLLLADIAARPRAIGLSLLIDHLPQATGRREIMSGIVLSPGSEARREQSSPPAGDLGQLSRLAQKRHNVEQLLARIERGDPSASAWLSQIDDLTAGLGERQTSEILWQLGQRYARAGRGQSAAEALALLVQRHPRHALADAAALWLVQYYASSERAWRERRENQYSVQLATATSQRDEPGRPIGPTTDNDGAPLEIIDRSQQTQVSTVGHTQLALPDLSPAERAGRALRAAKEAERARPILFARAEFQFPLAVATRSAGREAAAARSLGAGGLSWKSCTAAEQWLLDRKGPPPKKLLSVVTALEKPTLDGRLDELLWQVAKPVALTGIGQGSAELPAAAVLAHDHEFLYVAISCRKAAGCDYQADQQPRPHDSDLAGRDHVRLCLDVDRDYATWWELAIDHRGFPAASCAGDPTWNPQWFIAVGGDADWWTVEAAIPLVELGPRKPQVRDVWAAQIQRIVPNHGLSSFSQPAAVRIRPEGFGLLVFE
jgi:photosystem II stability/assembly factor-like uncharacterized protein